MRKFWLVFILMAPITAMTQIAPAVAAALIVAGSALVGSMMSNKANKEEQERNRELAAWQAKKQAETAGFQAQSDSHKTQLQGEQEAFRQMMDGYGKAFL